MKILADMADPSFFEMRAVEMIHEARTEPTEACVQKLQMAISLLALACAERINAANAKEAGE